VWEDIWDSSVPDSASSLAVAALSRVVDDDADNDATTCPPKRG
jgi:hypothetical protein